MYFDGHERPEVIRDRQERFLPAIEEMKKKAVWVQEDNAGNVSIVNADKPYLPVSADQKGHHSNERPGWYKYLLIMTLLTTHRVESNHKYIIHHQRFWGVDDMRSCPAKGDGKLIMTSDFISPLGRVRYHLS